MRLAISTFVLLASNMITFPAYAYTECSVTLNRVFSGDDGYIWLSYTNGGSAYLVASDPDREATLALATTALVAGRSVSVRYLADGVPCNEASRMDLTGFWLL